MRSLESRSRALAWLAARIPAGNRSGAFPVEMRAERDAGAAASDATVFATALALPALAAARDDRAEALVAAGRAFLLRERLAGGLWRFWPRAHPRHGDLPADLDDSCCAGAILAAAGMAKAPAIALLAAQRDAQGRFRTWCVPRREMPLSVRIALRGMRAFSRPEHPFWSASEAEPGDVDAGVNANVLWLIGDRPETESAARWLVDLVARGAEAGADRWHGRSWSVRYFIARAAAAGTASLSPAASHLARRVEGAASQLATGGRAGGPDEAIDAIEAVGALDAVDLALAVCVGSRSGADAEAVRALAARLIELQAADGSWPSAPLWFGG
ncbi:MAG: hypothetical protein ABIV06_10335, partial [Thermoanaerobaculia bacterium]